ncbi:hypothetical protein DJ69_00710 [Halorubrum persicum]|uniref:Uncharacterized protein n=1 Tax=Halorubrum persicum TaxID=1383844 RepID=A0A2G1WNE2_9EURY|nr:GLUG motif-containing protein [Halorubrum persicum]PHQ40524.1 hypothetical protein DJ69_00710 [Halorubrum persicum]
MARLTTSYIMIVSVVSMLAMVGMIGGIAGTAQGQTGTGPSDAAVSNLPGSGTADDPYVITTAAELQAMEDDLSAQYVLDSDINASETAEWHGGSGFDPVGPNESTAFTGSLDGNGHTITGLTINRPATNAVGLFGVAAGGDIQSLTLTDVTIVGQQSTGAIAGESDVLITDVTVIGAINGTESVGGVTGVTTGAVTNVTTDETVNGTDTVGGVAGLTEFDMVLTDVDSHSTVTGTDVVGGVTGNNLGTIKNVTASGTVDGRNTTGGVVGDNSDPGGLIENAVASGNVTGMNDVGGLAGVNGPTLIDGDAEIRNVSASGSVNGQLRVGGLVGRNSGTIQEATASGAVTGNESVGGLVGQNGVLADDESLIGNTKASGSVGGSNAVGGLVGVNQPGGIVRTSFVTGAVTGSPTAGGLVGANPEIFDESGTVHQAYWDTDTTGRDISAGNVTGLTTAEMTGENALSNMTQLSDFFWQPRATDYPVLRSQSSQEVTSDTLNISLSETTITAGTLTEITVTVTNAQTGASVENATVEISDLQQSTTTDTAGTATLTVTPSVAGLYPVSVTADSYTNSTVTLTVEESTLNYDITGVSVVPSTVDANTTVDHDLSYTVTDTSNDGNSDTYSITLPNSASFEGVNSLTVTDANGAEISTGSGVSLADANGGTDNQATFGIQPDSSFDTSSVTIDANVTVNFQDVPETTTEPITLDVSDSLQGDTSAQTDVTIESEGAAPVDPTDRALQITGKNDPANLTQDDVTIAITEFERGNQANGIDITQDDVTAVITLFERN